MSNSANLLSNIYLFKKLNDDDLELISKISRVETYPTGDDVFTQGDKAMALYVIKFGSVRVHQKTSQGDSVSVAQLGTGSHFGEMAMLDGELRSASATAIEKSEIIYLEYTGLEKILNENPRIAMSFYREMAHFLCGRLRVTTNDLSYAREKNLRHF